MSLLVELWRNLITKNQSSLSRVVEQLTVTLQNTQNYSNPVKHIHKQKKLIFSYIQLNSNSYDMGKKLGCKVPGKMSTQSHDSLCNGHEI